MRPVLSIKDLTLHLQHSGKCTPVLSGITLEVMPGEIVGLVGESGSGKSITSLAVMGLLDVDGEARISGRIAVLGQDVISMAEEDFRRMRGADMAMVFQEPMTALNPIWRVGELMIDVIRTHHRKIRRNEAHSLAASLLADMHIRDVERVLQAYPFELSGGMRQRVLIALAFACHPKLLIADEPTTALDVTVQAQILSLLKEMARRHNTAVLFISHDLGVVSELCARLYVIKDGKIMEAGSTESVLLRPQSSYTKALLAALPEFSPPRQPLPINGISQVSPIYHQREESRSGASSLLEVSDLHVEAKRKSMFSTRTSDTIPILKGVSLSLRPGTTLGVIGESGCGKSTLARTIVGLIRPTSGAVKFCGHQISGPGPTLSKQLRQGLQMVFQDPRSSLNPRMRVWEILTEPLLALGRISELERRQRAAVLADQVGLSKDGLDRYPHAFSGGQRQRISLGRALSTEPRLLILDEPTSALDVSIQAQILNLLLRLQDELGLSYLFISHDVSVIRHMADEVIVMRSGEVVEAGRAGQVLGSPRHPYTRQLIMAVPKVRQAS